MNIIDCLTKAFPHAEKSMPQEAILTSPNVMELPDTKELIETVPAYMLWCARHSDSQELVMDYTLAALAEYGRCKSPGITYLNFKYTCSQSQARAVVSFLEWASATLPFHDEEMVERALRNWRNATNK